MRLLIDESLQRDLAGVLSGHGHDAVHVADVGLQGAPDIEVLAKARTDVGWSSPRIPTDFGTLLALSGASGASVVLLRRSGRRVRERARIVLIVLDLVADQLATGALLETGSDSDSWPVRVTFGAAGLAAAVGLVGVARQLQSRWSRYGANFTGLSAGLAGAGIALGSFAGFLAAYVGILFAMPLGALVMGVGLFREPLSARWVRWVPLLLVMIAVVTYGFHALAREVWDPPDSVLFLSVGGFLALLGAGMSAANVHTTVAATTPAAPAG